MLRKNIKYYEIKQNLIVDKNLYNIFKNEIKNIYNLPKKRNYPYFPFIFTHLLDDSVRMWLFLNDEEIYSKIQDECSIHVLLNSFFLTIITNLLITYSNDVTVYPSINEYIYYISGTTSMTFLICSVANMMIIMTNINKSNPQLIRFDVAKNINNFSYIFKLSAFSFYLFIVFITLALYTNKYYILNYTCPIIFITICLFYSSPFSVAFKINYISSPRLMLNIMPWSEDLRQRSYEQINTLMINFKNTNSNFTDMIDDIITPTEIINETNSV